MGNYYALTPEIVFTVLLISYFILGLLIKNKYFTGFAPAVIALFTMIFIHKINGTAFNGMFVADKFSQSLKFVFLANLFLCTIISLRYEKIRKDIFYEYSLLMLLSTLAMMLIVSSRDFIMLFLSVEFMSLGVYLLSGFILNDLKSNEASLKYYILGSLASVFFLLGITIIYAVTGTTTFNEVNEALRSSGNLSSFYLFLGVIGVITALAFKAGLAPFHQWSPDVYEGAPTTITAFMSIGPKAAAVGALARVILESFSYRPELWIVPLTFLSLLTMAVGNILALRQRNIKRLLAYSSIAHAGYLMLAILPASMEALNAINFYLIVYTFMNIGAFSIVLLLPKGEDIEAYSGVAFYQPIFALFMLAFLFSLTGIPPFAGFIAKFQVFMHAIKSGYLLVALAGIIFSILSAFYYLKIGVKMFFIKPITQNAVYAIPWNLKLSVIVSFIFITVLGVFPFLLIN